MSSMIGVKEGLFKHKVPIECYWKGFATDTHSLKQNGWRIFAKENWTDFSTDYKITIIAVSPEVNGIALYGDVNIRRQDFFTLQGPYEACRLAGYGEGLIGLFAKYGLEFTLYRAKDEARIVHSLSSERWGQMVAAEETIDGLANFGPPEGPMTQVSMQSLKFFNYEKTEGGIYLEKSNVDECLKHILLLQSNDKVDSERKTKMLAKIYSLEE